MSYIFKLLKVNRSEYFIGLWIGCIANLILWFDPSLSPSVGIIMLTLFYAGLFYMSGFLANSIADADLEITYLNEKQDIASTVQKLGNPVLLRILFSLLGSSLVLSIIQAWMIRSLFPIFIYFIGLVLGVGYSFPPFRFKQRGFILHFVSLSISAFLLPVFLVAGTLQGSFSLEYFIVGLGYSFKNYAMEIGNQVKDRKYDQKLGISTLPFSDIALNSGIALLMLLAGMMVLILSLADIFDLSIPLMIIVFLIEIVFHSHPILTFWNSFRKILRPDYFERLNYARWQTLSMVGLLIIASLIRYGQTIIGPQFK